MYSVRSGPRAVLRKPNNSKCICSSVARNVRVLSGGVNPPSSTFALCATADYLPAGRQADGQGYYLLETKEEACSDLLTVHQITQTCLRVSPDVALAS